MDKIQLQQKIAEYYQKLPSDLQVVFSGMKWLEIINAISKKYNLNDEQIETLTTETTLVLLGVIYVDEYEETLKKDLSLSAEITDKILTEIDFSISVDIREQLTDVYNNNVNSLVEEKVNNGNWSQNINFVLSGGDYSSFLEEKNDINITKENPETAIENFNLEITDGGEHNKV